MSDTLPAVPCSDAARDRQDPMLGTAPPQSRFLLVEADSGWGFGGFPELPLPADLRTEVGARADRLGARVMLIRRPGRQSSTVCSMRAWCAVDTTARAGERVTWGTWAYPGELLSGVERLEELAARPAPAPDARPDRGDEALVLVCTHGKKDPCCAVRGRPVAAALARRWPEETWECSHTGGDRFAANLLLLPDGATYGGLGVDSALDAVEAHGRGEPATAYLRGAVGWSRPVQAAVVAVHEQLGPLPWGSVRPVGTAPAQAGAGDVLATTVRLELGDGRRAEVVVGEHLRPAARLTCRTAEGKVSQVPVPGTVRVLG
jgi:hypothetical protein